jgi:hypothetical protein
LDLFERNVPGLTSDLHAIVEDWSDTRIPCVDLASLYNRHPAFDFSRHVLQKSSQYLQLLTVPPCGWNDVGTPARLAQALQTARSVNSHPGATRKVVFNLAMAFDRAYLPSTPAGTVSSILDQPNFNVAQGAAFRSAGVSGSAHHGR